MPASKGKNLSSLVRSAAKRISISVSSAEDVALKQYVSSIDTSSSSRTITINKRSVKFRPSNSSSYSKSLSDLAIGTLKSDSTPHSADSTNQLPTETSVIFSGHTALDLVSSAESQVADDNKSMGGYLNTPWFPRLADINASFRRKEVARDRKHKWVFKTSQTGRFDRLVKMCATKLGTDAAIHVFGKLGRETGVKEYNALIRVCIENARETKDEEISLQQFYNAYQLFKLMRERGFQVEEETYGPFLMYLIHTGMVEEFHFFCDVIRDEDPDSLSRLAYYEMLLWVRVNNEEKIQELCNYVTVNDGRDKSNYQANYLLALCETDHEKELSLLLEFIDITKVSSLDHVAKIFRSMGKLLLESLAVKFLVAFKTSDVGAENFSNFIYNYAISIPNLAVEDVLLKFENLHTELDLTPSPEAYVKFIGYCCDSLKVCMALGIVDQMVEANSTLKIETFHSILDSCEDSCEYNLVYRIYSAICRHNLKPNNETFRRMINLCVKMKDFEGAYGMVRDLEKFNLLPTASLYNAIMAGYFREKNIYGGLKVLKQMEDADVKPDSQTFSYLIGISNCEQEIIKYYEEMKQLGVQVTKHVFMALINAYAACGLLEKAKQVVFDNGVPVKILNELKSVLVSALASHGQILDALNIYEEMKQAKCDLEPKSILHLIEHLKSEGQLSRLLRLLEELNDTDYWVDGCCRIILYCVPHKHLSSAIDLLKQLKDRFCDDEVATDVLFDEVFCLIAGTEPTDLQWGLDLLKVIKEELGLYPSRKSLDFLLSACANAKDLKNSLSIWKEYQTAGLPYNVLSFVRMYQALLASGDHKSAKNMLKKIPKDDPHVRCVIKACQATYVKPTSRKEKKAKRKGASKQ